MENQTAIDNLDVLCYVRTHSLLTRKPHIRNFDRRGSVTDGMRIIQDTHTFQQFTTKTMSFSTNNFSSIGF